MKNKIFILLLASFPLVAFLCHQVPNKEKMKRVLDRVNIKFVSFDIESPIRITCETFESNFGTKVTAFSIKDKGSLDSLLSLVNDLKPSSKGFKPDVRLIAEIHFTDGMKRLLCMSDIAIQLDGIEMEFEPRVLTFFQDRTKLVHR